MLDRSTSDRRRRKFQSVPATDLERRSARERKARFLKRREQGCFVVPLEVTPDIIDCLVGLDYLRERDSANPRKVGAAIAAALADAAQK
jgi:hypothetical protein